jgi:hypothetical protein
MHGELDMCPFERRIIGGGGAVLLRVDRDHAKRCVEAIRRRNPPAWSLQGASYHVSERKAPRRLKAVA